MVCVTTYNDGMKQKEITVAEAAAILGVRTATVTHHIRKGHLPARRAGARFYLLQPSDVAAFRPGPSGQRRN